MMGRGERNEREGRGRKGRRGEEGRKGTSPKTFLEVLYQTLQTGRDIHNKRDRFMQW